jgi:DNA-binding NarL/FixJ family response regulator
VAGIEPGDGTVPTTVLAVDDDGRFRGALRALVEASWPGVVAEEAASGEAAVALAQELSPDVVLIDIRMPGIGGIAATTAIKRHRPATLLLLVTSAHPDELPNELEDCPADAIVAKGKLRPQLLRDAWSHHAGDGGTKSAK